MRYLALFIALAACQISPAQDLTLEADAISKLRGVTTNLQKNKDGSVRLVRFSKPHVTDEHLVHIQAFKNIDYLAIVHPSISSRGIKNVAELINLDTLLLSETKADDEALSSLAKLEKLERLYLENTRVTDAGMKLLIPLANLRIISLKQTGITDKGISTLADLKSLETIVLNDTAIGDNAIKHLAKLPNLKHLFLTRTEVSGRGLEKLKNLELLDLTGCQISDDAVIKLSKLGRLKELQLYRTGISQSAYNQLRMLMPKTMIQVDETVRPPRRFSPSLLTRSTLEPSKSSIEKDQTGVLKPASLRLQSTGESPHFQRHVVPLLGKLGCNGRACHGSFQGQGGFRLSMFGYDFQADHENLTKGSDPRVNVNEPLESLILQKPASSEDHEGGKRFEKDGWEYRLLEKWIESGAKSIKNDSPKFVDLQVSPSGITFAKAGDTVQLKVIAVWSNGIREDVTCLSRFQSNDDVIADVSADGVVTAKGKGDTYIVTFYDNGISSTEVILPVTDQVGEEYPKVPMPTKIDQLVQGKLSRLGVVPSEICTDEEFLRRVSLDLIGTLPTPSEVRSFLADKSGNKRSRKIDELLDTPAYATWWTQRLCDLTGSNAGYLGGTEMAQPVALQWRTWLHRRVERNAGWDQIVRGIVLSRNRLPDQTYEQYTKRYSEFTARKNPTDYAATDNTMPHYWYRDNQSLPKDKALTFGYTFLGVQLGCAECHKHPYDQWSQDDFNKFTEFFTRIKKGAAPDVRIENQLARERLGVPVKLNTAALRRQSYLRIAAEGRPIPWFETYIQPLTSRQTARLLGGAELDISQLDDPREPLMAWLLQRNNPYFARSFVNRIWANYFNVGIIDPPDDLNLANPPSNKALLNYLANEFIEQGYDMKWLHREITSSDTYQRSWKTNKTNRRDLKNFSHSVVRRLQAEVIVDAIIQSTSRSTLLQNAKSNVSKRKINQHPKSYQTRAIDYSLLVFGKPLRTTTCDCERRVQPTLLQALYIRNDSEMIGLLQRNEGWVYEMSKFYGQELTSDLSEEILVAAKADRSAKLKDEESKKLVEEAYLRVLSRFPTIPEIDQSLKHMNGSKNTVEGLRDLLWALLNTEEFITNH